MNSDLLTVRAFAVASLIFLLGCNAEQDDKNWPIGLLQPDAMSSMEKHKNGMVVFFDVHTQTAEAMFSVLKNDGYAVSENVSIGPWFSLANKNGKFAPLPEGKATYAVKRDVGFFWRFVLHLPEERKVIAGYATDFGG